MRVSTRKALAGLAACAATIGMGAGIASAGEITGNGRLKTVKGASECAYSGLNDSPVPGDPFEGRVQSFGQIVKLVGPMGGVPGMACNPTKPPLPEP